jgi:putative addiction module component (TIGR02574 family)
MLITKDEIQAMTIAEKNELLDILWESFEREDYIDDAEEETEEEKQILLERLETYKSNPASGVKWENLKDDLLKHRHD